MTTMVSITSDVQPWTVVSDLPGRVRVRWNPALFNVETLRHTRLVLGGCPWLLGFRINPLAGSLCIHVSSDHRPKLEELLALALDPGGTQLEPDCEALVRSKRASRVLLHGGVCTGILLFDLLIPLPLTLLVGLSSVMIWPRVLAGLRSLFKGETDYDLMELGLSGLMLIQGLPEEVLVDLSIHDGTGLMQQSMLPSDETGSPKRLLQRLEERIHLTSPDPDQQPICLSDAKRGQKYLIHAEQMCPLRSRVECGDLLVIDKRINGDWQPRWLKQGDGVKAGALVIKGQGVLSLQTELDNDPTYALLQEQQTHSCLEDNVLAGDLATIGRWMNPFLLLSSGALIATGAGHAAFAPLQFTPLHNWEQSVSGARLTAVADLKLHNVTLHNPNTLSSFGKIKHLVVTFSSLNHHRGINLEEHRIEDGLAEGSLVRLLAGIQSWLVEEGGPSIWADQLREIDKPTAIDSVTIESATRRFNVVTADGQRYLVEPDVTESPSSSDALEILHPLTIRRDGNAIGRITMTMCPDDHWIQASSLLKRQGIKLHVVSTLPSKQLKASVHSLGLPDGQIHGGCDGAKRVALVRRLQGQSQTGVAYLGYLIQDLAALELADVSIGMRVEDDSLFISELCDLTIPTNAGWIPRLIELSRRLQSTENSNFGLITTTQLISTLATVVGWIPPLQTILLADLPMLIAELHNILSVERVGYPAGDARPQLAAFTSRHEDR